MISWSIFDVLDSHVIKTKWVNSNQAGSGFVYSKSVAVDVYFVFVLLLFFVEIFFKMPLWQQGNEDKLV